jgi:hypothetical protein
VRLSPLGTSATVWPIVSAPNDRWWMWSSRRNENYQGKLKYSEKTCHSATLSTTNPTWPDLGSNLGRRGEKPATNLLSYGTARNVNYILCMYRTNGWINYESSDFIREATGYFLELESCSMAVRRRRQGDKDNDEKKVPSSKKKGQRRVRKLSSVISSFCSLLTLN